MVVMAASRVTCPGSTLLTSKQCLATAPSSYQARGLICLGPQHGALLVCRILPEGPPPLATAQRQAQKQQTNQLLNQVGSTSNQQVSIAGIPATEAASHAQADALQPPPTASTGSSKASETGSHEASQQNEPFMGTILQAITAVLPVGYAAWLVSCNLTTTSSWMGLLQASWPLFLQGTLLASCTTNLAYFLSHAGSHQASPSPTSDNTFTRLLTSIANACQAQRLQLVQTFWWAHLLHVAAVAATSFLSLTHWQLSELWVPLLAVSYFGLSFLRRSEFLAVRPKKSKAQYQIEEGETGFVITQGSRVAARNYLWVFGTVASAWQGVLCFMQGSPLAAVWAAVFVTFGCAGYTKFTQEDA